MLLANQVAVLIGVCLCKPGGQGGGFGFFGSDSALRDASREAAAAGAGVPHTIVRAAAVADRPGGNCQLSFSAGPPAGGSGGGGKSGEIR